MPADLDNHCVRRTFGPVVDMFCQLGLRPIALLQGDFMFKRISLRGGGLGF